MNTRMTNEQIMHVLAAHDLFSTLNGAYQSDLIAQGSLISHERGELLFSPYDRCDRLILLLSGALSITFALPSGGRALLRDVRSGEVFGSVASQMHANYPGWVSSETSGWMLSIPYSYILTACSDPAFLEAYLHGVGSKMGELIERHQIMSCTTLEKKLASYLLQRHAAGPSDLLRCPSVSDLALYLGNSRESVSRKLTEFEHHGMIVHTRGEIILKDPLALEQVLLD